LAAESWPPDVLTRDVFVSTHTRCPLQLLVHWVSLRRRANVVIRRPAKGAHRDGEETAPKSGVGHTRGGVHSSPM